MQRRELFKGALALLTTAIVAPKELFARGGIVPPGPPYIVGLQPCETTLTKEQIAAFAPQDHPNCQSVMSFEYQPGFSYSKWTVSEGRFNISTTMPEYAVLEAGDIVELGDGVQGEVESVTLEPAIRLSVKLLPHARSASRAYLRPPVNTSAGYFNE